MCGNFVSVDKAIVTQAKHTLQQTISFGWQTCLLHINYFPLN